MRRARVDKGEESYFVSLYPQLRRFACAIRTTAIEPDDLLQEALARTLTVRTLESLDDPVAYLRTAMIRIASNMSRSKRRREARERRFERVGASIDEYPSDVVELMQVPVKVRAVIYLTAVEGQSFREAGELVGCSEQAARAIAMRGLKDLRRSSHAQHS
jgi:RNA polymerase sigma factor (sigma-70 family)